MQKKKRILLRAGAALLCLTLLAALAGSIYLKRQPAGEAGGFHPEEQEETVQELRESAWIEQQGEYVRVHLFSYENDYWHGQMLDGKIKGCWGTFSVTGEDAFTVTAYPDSYCDFAGRHSFRLGKDRLEIDGTVYERADYDKWIGKAYADDTVPEDAIAEGED